MPDDRVLAIYPERVEAVVAAGTYWLHVTKIPTHVGSSQEMAGRALLVALHELLVTPHLWPAVENAERDYLAKKAL